MESPAASEAADLGVRACVTGNSRGAKPATGPIGSMITMLRTPSARRDNAAVGTLTLAGEPSMMSAALINLHLGFRQDLALLLGQHLGDVVGARANEVGGLRSRSCRS